MANPASVSDLLAVLELSAASGDTDLADQLRDRFGIAPTVDLVSAPGTVAPAEVLAALTSAVASVAAMVRDLYAWLGQLADVRSIANLSVQVADAQMRTMHLDPAHYKAYESIVVEEASRIEFHPTRLALHRSVDVGLASHVSGRTGFRWVAHSSTTGPVAATSAAADSQTSEHTGLVSWMQNQTGCGQAFTLPR